MADPYTLGLTASQINDTLIAAQNSDNVPAAGQSNLVNSNRIYEAIQDVTSYVDARDRTEYALKYSGSTGTKSVTSSFADWDISSVVGVNRALVIIEMWDASTGVSVLLKTKGSSVDAYTTASSAGWGAGGVITGTVDQGGTLVVITDASGVIQIKGKVSATGINYKIQAYQKLA